MKSLLPSMECQFKINLVGEDTGQKFQGEFTYKRLNILSKTQAEKMKLQFTKVFHFQ